MICAPVSYGTGALLKTEHMEQNVLRKDRVRQVDLAKSIAILAVIVIHISGEPLLYQPVGSGAWMQNLLFGSASRFAVPLFFLCSGALLLDENREVSARHIWTRNIPHMLAALFFWAAAYAMAPFVYHGNFDFAAIGKKLLDVLCWRHEQHLYFLHIMLLVYAALPVTRVLTERADEKTVQYALLFWCVTGVLLPAAKSFRLLDVLGGIPMQWPLNMTWSAIGCTALGWYLRKRPLGWQAAAGYFAAGFAISFGGTLLLSVRKGMLVIQLLEGLSPGPLLMAAGVFCLCAEFAPKLPNALQKAAETGGRASFCIYLVHQFALKLLRALGVTAQFAAPLKSVPVVAILCLAISFAVYLALSKIPFVRRWLM